MSIIGGDLSHNPLIEKCNFAVVKSIGQKLFLFAAWTILFVHSVVPHVHHKADSSAICADEISAPAGIIEALSGIFHFNVGENHLEDFAEAAFDWQMFLPSNIFVFLPECNSLSPFPLTNISVFGKSAHAEKQRGPPSLS